MADCNIEILSPLDSPNFPVFGELNAAMKFHGDPLIYK